MKPTKSSIIKKISNKLKRKKISELRSLLYDLTKIEEKNILYTSIPAKLIVEGKKYHIVIVRREKKDYQNLLLMQS